MSLRYTMSSTEKLDLHTIPLPEEKKLKTPATQKEEKKSLSDNELNRLIQDESFNHSPTKLVMEKANSNVSNFLPTDNPNTMRITDPQSKSEKFAKSTNQNYMQIRIQSDLEKVDELSDDWPLLEPRKAILRIFKAFSELFQIITRSTFFQVIVIFVIFFNTVVLALEDPKAVILPHPYYDFELFFVYFYTAEFGMLVIANGFFLGENAYFRDGWNLLDFTILVTAWLSAYAGSGFRLSALRTLRILRPLRTISSIRGMKALFLSVMNSMKSLGSALLILFFFMLIFSIGAIQLWIGTLKYRCIDIETGIYNDEGIACGDYQCPFGYECAYVGDNPNFGVTAFDNIFISLITVFQIVTLEGWSSAMVLNMTSFSYYSIFYYMPLVFIAANLILNFTLAIITISFKDVSTRMNSDPSDEILVVSDEIFRAIYKHSSEAFLSTGKTSGDTKIIKENGEKNSELLDNNKESQEKFGKSLGFELVSECISSENDINFQNLIENNSRMVKYPRNILKPNGIYYAKIPSGLSIKKSFLDPELSQCNEMLRADKIETNLIVTGIQPDNESDKRPSEMYSSVKNMLTIKHRTLARLEKNPAKCEKSRFKIVETYKIQSKSLEDVVPFEYNPFVDCQEFYYRKLNINDPLLEKATSILQQVREKYPEIHSIFQLFAIFERRSSKDEAFAELKFSVKDFINTNKNNFVDIGDWSGYEISPNNPDKHQSLIQKISNMRFRIWSEGKMGQWEKIKFPLKLIMTNNYMSFIIMLTALLNTAVLAVDHYEISQSDSDILSNMNLFFTYFFGVIFVLTAIAIGVKELVRDFMNYLDFIVVVLSFAELFLLSGASAVNAFRAIRVFRIFRVIRVVRIFRYLKSMVLIIEALGRSFSSLMYLFLILVLFQIIFTLLSMQVYGGNFIFPEGLPRGNFDSFHWAFVTTFQILSTENCNDIIASSLRSQVGPISCLLLISWIVLGNYILLNLFLAILLDSFADVGRENIGQEDVEWDKEIQDNPKLQKKIKMLDEYNDGDSEASENEFKMKYTQFDANSCHRSYFIFSQTNLIRKWSYTLIQNSIFDHVLLTVIIANSFKLVWDTYIINASPSSTEYSVSSNIDTFFTIAFAVEFAIKSIALGFILGENTYLRNSWNVLDFFIVALSVIDLSVASINIPIIKVFRVLRALRPLKLIKHNISMKIVVTALLDSMFEILNVLVVILVIWVMFAILGVSLLSGKLYQCSNQNIETMEECALQGFEWVNTPANFDNVGEAMIVLFIVMSQESWPNRMLEAVDGQGIGLGPKVNANPYIAYYFIIWLMISNFFLLNLFTVVIFENFNKAKKNESSLSALMLTKEQLLWTEIQQLILSARPGFQTIHKPENSFRLLMYNLSKNKNMDIFITGVILLNMVVMAMPYYDAPESYILTLEVINSICTCIFILEAIMKITGLGLTYFKSHWNKFDFFIAVTSLIDIVLTYSISINLPLLRQGPQLIRVLRVTRVSRLIRLVKSLEMLQKLLIIMGHALPAIINVLGLLLLLFFIYAILGSFLFNSVSNGNAINEWYNFENFDNSMLILWRISTGEDYPTIMWDCVYQLGSIWYVLYFITFVALIDFVILDLFIAIILQNYEEFSTNPQNSVALFSKDIKIFKRWWFRYNKGNKLYKVGREELIEIVSNISLEFNLLPDKTTIKVIKFIGSMNIEMDNEGYFYFNDILFGLLKKKYTRKLEKRGKWSVKILRMEEIKTKRALAKVRAAYRESKEKVFVQNLFINTILLKGIFRNWKTFTKREKQSPRSITPVFSEIDYPGENSFEFQ